MKNTFYALEGIILLITLCSCGHEGEGVPTHGRRLAGAMADPSDPLFADLSEFDLVTRPPSSRSFALDDSVPLESLLEFDGAVTVDDPGGPWTMTPIKISGSQKVFIASGTSRDSEVCPTLVRQYLIEPPGTAFVATMVSVGDSESSSWDYFRREGFFGYIFYSSLGRELEEIECYTPGHGLLSVRPLLPAEPRGPNDSEIILVAVPTRSPDAWYLGELEASVVSAYAVKKTSMLLEMWNKRPLEPDSCTEETGRKGGGGSRLPSVLTFELKADACGDGRVYGEGRYPAETVVQLQAVPSDGSAFYYWTGDLAGTSASTLVKMTEDIGATAVFGPEDLRKPCYDATGGVFFPIGGRTALAPTASGNPATGGYGNVRIDDRGRRPHRGWDIAAEPGTPFYAPVDGTISGFLTSYVPDGCNNAGGCGNKIGVTFTLGGKEYAIFFLHLGSTDKDNPGRPENGIAVNPRTGDFWQPGDKVLAGELLGRTGATGLAYNVPNKHLHVEIHTNPRRWPATGRSEDLWCQFEDPAVLFGDILSRGQGGAVTDTALHFPCDPMPESDNQQAELVNPGFGWSEMIFPNL